MNRRLPLWRLAAAIFILGGMAVVLLSLTPFYVEDWQLRNYVRGVMHGPQLASLSDATLEKDVTSRAQALGLPVTANNLLIVHKAGTVNLDIRYTVHFNLYQVDLHFHTAAANR